ncbi:MAG TPA: M3 family oligoendopeptidase, partial [Ktedonobacterales bacterium]|nr:M3 family oligoendopeptidase [Ktedonobacterales bacterium]
RTLSAYISAFVTTDTRDPLAQARYSELQRHSARLTQLTTRFTAWIGTQDIEALLAQSEVAREHAFALRKAKTSATHLMSPAEEALYAELNLPGGAAWGKLHGNVTSQLSVPIEIDGQMRETPMSVVRTLAFEADRDVRRRAYEAELAGWERVSVPLAAALNSIKGQVNVATARRGWRTPLDAALFDAHIDQPTLDAMLGAARDYFPVFRRYLKAKAHALGLQQLTWYDLFAPMAEGNKAWSYEEANLFIVEQFGTFTPRLSAFAARAFRENWIDAEPRPGKQDGAYCMWVQRDESRVFANFKPAFGGMSTLAHELGHGYHNMLLAGRTMLQRDTPMTLAETASIFCETIVRNAALAEAERDGDTKSQIEILEASLQGSCQVVVDITSRFLLEQGVFEKRRERELSVDELNALMLDAQRQTYGDGLDPDALHPYMWAMKPHYYSAGRSYYNFPYMFGLLFGLGLYARYQQEGGSFTERYDDLLASTGLDDAATLAQRFGIDIRDSEFWRASLDLIRADVERFEALVGAPAGD